MSDSGAGGKSFDRDVPLEPLLERFRLVGESCVSCEKPALAESWCGFSEEQCERCGIYAHWCPDLVPPPGGDEPPPEVPEPPAAPEEPTFECYACCV
jgi:hypothetical protein